MARQDPAEQVFCHCSPTTGLDDEAPSYADEFELDLTCPVLSPAWTMPNSDTQTAPLDEPGRRQGEGSETIVPHLQRQTQTQLKVPLKRATQPASEGPDSVPSSS